MGGGRRLAVAFGGSDGARDGVVVTVVVVSRAVSVTWGGRRGLLVVVAVGAGYGARGAGGGDGEGGR